MAYTFTDPFIGLPPIGTPSTTQGVPLGTIRRAVDPTFGEGEFIYLLGVANTIVGSLVTYNATTFQTTLAAQVAYTANPVAVAMSANVASNYDWYQIEGLAVIKKTAVVLNPQVTIALSATAGRVKGTSTTGMQIGNARSANLATVAAATSTITALINRPFLQTQIA
jgi:hypothetical protein